MNPEIEQLKKEIEDLKNRFELLTSVTSIPMEVDNAFRERLGINSLVDLPTEFASLPLPAVTAPSGGATIDSQARTAILDLRTRLEDAGIIET